MTRPFSSEFEQNHPIFYQLGMFVSGTVRHPILIWRKGVQLSGINERTEKIARGTLFLLAIGLAIIITNKIVQGKIKIKYPLPLILGIPIIIGINRCIEIIFNYERRNILQHSLSRYPTEQALINAFTNAIPEANRASVEQVPVWIQFRARAVENYRNLQLLLRNEVVESIDWNPKIEDLSVALDFARTFGRSLQVNAEAQQAINQAVQAQEAQLAVNQVLEERQRLVQEITDQVLEDLRRDPNFILLTQVRALERQSQRQFSSGA